MAKRVKVKAPYNFVPFPLEPFYRYDSVSDLPPHDAIVPHLLTGSIKVKISAHTPIFIGEGTLNKEEGPEKFFRTPDGKVAIPGSTIRGLSRENVQILGLGTVDAHKDFFDFQIYFRTMVSKAIGVKKALSDFYKYNILNVSNENEESFSKPLNVKSGFLCNEGGTYVIYESDAPYRISRASSLVEPFRVNKDSLSREPAHIEKVFYSVCDGEIVDLKSFPEGNMKSGVLLFTGRPVGKSLNKVYLFPDFEKDAPKVTISKEDILSYRIDYENRFSSLSLRQKGDFWALPKPHESKPVFYVMFDGHIYFGMSYYPRVGYPHKLSWGLPDSQKAEAEKGTLSIDYPNAIFGFYKKKEQSYASRVFFEDFTLIGEAEETDPVNPLLRSPRPSYFPGYTLGGVPYTSSDFKLRGYKQYWLKEGVCQELGDGFVPLKSGSEFEGTIRFKNLHPDELGLLILSLQLKDDCYQNIGRGKPYGYGRCKISVTQLCTYDINKLYESFEYSPSQNEKELKEYINEFSLFIKDCNVSNSESVWKNFFAMKSYIFSNYNNVSYMNIDDYRLTSAPLPYIRNIISDEQASKMPEVTVGEELCGKVVSTPDFGVFVDINVGINGFVNNEKMTPEQKEAIKPGDMAKVRIDDVFYNTKKEKYEISLSLI